jgi:hypothetical protein
VLGRSGTRPGRFGGARRRLARPGLGAPWLSPGASSTQVSSSSVASSRRRAPRHPPRATWPSPVVAPSSTLDAVLSSPTVGLLQRRGDFRPGTSLTHLQTGHIGDTVAAACARSAAAAPALLRRVMRSWVHKAGQNSRSLAQSPSGFPKSHGSGPWLAALCASLRARIRWRRPAPLGFGKREGLCVGRREKAVALRRRFPLIGRAVLSSRTERASAAHSHCLDAGRPTAR